MPSGETRGEFYNEAQTLIAAVKEVGLKVPLVVRLEGTNAELGKKIINDDDLLVVGAAQRVARVKSQMNSLMA